MGKQNRKKSAKKGSKEHKAKLKERREKREQLIDNNRTHNEGNQNQNRSGFESSAGGLSQETILEGDRVFVISTNRNAFMNDEGQDDPDLRRGVVKKLEDDGAGVRIAHVQLLASIRVGDESTQKVPIHALYRDCMSLTTKFQVGDSVVCHTPRGILPGVIQYLWPVWTFNRSRNDRFEIYKFPIYEVQIDPSIRSRGRRWNENQEPYSVVILSDNEDQFMGRITETKFGVGDRVVINRKMTDLHSVSPRVLNLSFSNDKWIHATISEVDAFGTLDNEYGVYACVIELHGGKEATVYVRKDNDEYIALVTSDPRKRLFHAIEEDCSFDHIDHLVKEYSIDVSLIMDLLIPKAIEFGSFNMCRWLEEKQNVDLASLSFPSGNNILHEISLSSHASRFVKQFANILTRSKNLSLIKDRGYGENHVKAPIDRQNDNGKTWLDILRDDGDFHALDHALLPQHGLFWYIANENEFESLVTNQTSKDPPEVVRLACDYFLSNVKLWYQYRHLTSNISYGDCEETINGRKTMKNFCGKKLIRFTRQWAGFHRFCQKDLRNVVEVVTSQGYSRIFRELLDGDESIRYLTLPIDDLSSSVNVFVQPELYGANMRTTKRQVDIVGLAIEGERLYPPVHDNEKIHSYIHLLLKRVSSELLQECKGFPLMPLLEKGNNVSKPIRNYQIAILTDSKTVPGRIKILDILANYPGVRLPTALEALKARQCGMLYWMVHRSYVKLNSKASTDSQLWSPTLSAQNLEFLGPQHRIPNTISTGTFLSFVSIEYDSLHALSWLSKDQNISLDVSINGFTFLHTCAYFGRLEIILWFYTRPEWKNTVSIFSTRQGFEHASAVHVAVMRNHTNAADLLLRLRCPSIDEKERSPDFFALKSSHDFVQNWGKNMLKPIRLEEDIRKFFKLLAKRKYDTVRRFVSSSNCLSIARWKDANIYHASIDSSLPSGETYESIMLKCIDDHNDDFVKWICDFVTRAPNGSNDYYCELYQFWSPSQYWADPKFNDLPTVLDLICSCADDFLITLLSDPLMRSIHVIDSSIWLPENTPSCVRQQIVIRLTYEKILLILKNSARDEIKKGADVAILEAISMKFRQAAQKVAGEDEEALERIFSKNKLFTRDVGHFIHMDIFFGEAYTTSKVQYFPRSLIYRAQTGTRLNRLHFFLAVENYYDLIVWCVDHGKGWTAQMELDIVHIASFLGHDRIVSFFLDAHETKWLASCTEMQVLAILGAAEAGRERPWKGLIKQYGLPLDQHLALIDNKDANPERNNRRRACLYSSSHAMAIVHGYLYTNDPENRSAYGAMISLLLEDQRYQSLLLLKIVQAVVKENYNFTCFEGVVSFVDLLYGGTGKFLPRQDHAIQQMLFGVSETVLKRILSRENEESFKIVNLWMTATRKWGVDMQSLNERVSFFSKEITSLLLKLQEEQQRQWTKLDIIKKGQPISIIKAAVANGSLNFHQTDRSGLSLIHLASAYDRIDVLKWLVEYENSDIRQKDDRGRTPLQIARASKASCATKWIEERQAMETLTRFFKKHLRKRLAYIRQSRMAFVTSKIQALQRGKMVRKSFRNILLLRVEESLRFHSIWDKNLANISGINPNFHTWSSARKLNESRTSTIDDLDEMIRTSEKLEAASVSALSDESGDDHNELDQPENLTDTEDDILIASYEPSCEITKKTKILLTDYVMKWLRHADAKYREFFVRRLKQLQKGERSRILAKRLKGSSSTIFETYLEQKSGHRILWRNQENGTILIWFVAKHKNVSRLMQLIDDSESRSTRQRISLAEAFPETATDTSTTNSDQQHRILINPLGNVPLKLFEFEEMDIDEIRNETWSPRLYLTEQERIIVESNGSVLLLGRSGTGKTICICNRMEFDMQRFHHFNGFRQLFVARSQRLCRYVSETVGFDAPDDSFTTYSKLIITLERRLPSLKSTRGVFLTSQKMDFTRFKRELYMGGSQKSEVQIDPLLAWTSIRTFCKGSIEALQEPLHILGKNAFLNLGERRCRLDKAQREAVYDVFLRYQRLCSEHSLWDDCDRITSLVLRLREARRNESASFKSVHRNKIYIDEIQDYTQAEICIFFLLSGSGDLFMAGDPAQSVVEGVEFRFEDVRSVAYHMSNDKNRDLIPQKPKVVTVNFRSHSGVMNTAAAILRCMFDAFPYSAKQLAEDRGLFRGPRPGVFNRVQIDRLHSLISEKLNGVVVLVHDASVQYFKKALGDYQLVYGIRAAKGLEFKSVIILDFFSELPREFQKPWRDLLLGRIQHNPMPELEGHLKLLYTAVTRCIEQLFFAETTRTSAGDAFVRWTTTKTIRPMPLATRQNIDEVEKMILTQDEWIASGLDNAEMAESVEETNLDESIVLIEKALYCFEQGKNAKMSQKARTYRTALLFRRENFLQEIDRDVHNHDSCGSVEVKAAELTCQLLTEGSLLAALRVVKASIPFFGEYSRDRLETVILPKLHAIEQSF